MQAVNYISNWSDVVAHVLKHYPQESGGIVTLDNVFIPLTNRADDPVSFYEISTADWSEHAENVKCVLHSHCTDPTLKLEYDPRTPSKDDMLGQLSSGVEWAIVVCEGENVTIPFFFGDASHRPPLMDREFIHSMQDCLAFVRDWLHLEAGIHVPDCARRPDWYLHGEDLFEDNFAAWGFVDVSALPEQRNDVIFMQFESNVVNHIGVLTQPGMVAHHLFNRLPKVETTAKYKRYIKRRIRHNSLMKESK